MWMTKCKPVAAVMGAMMAVTGGGLRTQQEVVPKTASPATKAAVSAAMTQTEAKLAQLRELIQPQPGEHVTNMAKIAWERDPWVATVKAGKEGKPVLVYAEGAAGI